MALDLSDDRENSRDPRLMNMSQQIPAPVPLTLDDIKGVLEAQDDALQARMNITLKNFMGEALREFGVAHEAKQGAEPLASSAPSDVGDERSGDKTPLGTPGSRNAPCDLDAGSVHAGPCGNSHAPSVVNMDTSSPLALLVDGTNHTPSVNPLTGRVYGPPPGLSVERNHFDQAKAKIADVLTNCQIRRTVLEDEGDLYRSNLPYLLDTDHLSIHA